MTNYKLTQVAGDEKLILAVPAKGAKTRENFIIFFAVFRAFRGHDFLNTRRRRLGLITDKRPRISNGE
jgi:hypothetical protein